MSDTTEPKWKTRVPPVDHRALDLHEHCRHVSNWIDGLNLTTEQLAALGKQMELEAGRYSVVQPPDPLMADAIARLDLGRYEPSGPDEAQSLVQYRRAYLRKLKEYFQ